MTTTANVRSWRRRLVAAAAASVLALMSGLVVTDPAQAYEPVDVVHAEQVEVGPYDVTVGFSVWPLRAMQSLDFTFVPDGGIADKEGVLTVKGASTVSELTATPLVRHPRKLEVWGLDIVALSTAGTYEIDLEIDGPQGVGKGELTGLSVLAQPGPPLALSWAVCSLPFLALVTLVGVAWHRIRPGKRRLIL